MRLIQLLETLNDPDRTDVRWAVGPNLDKASLWIRKQIERGESDIHWVNIEDVFKTTGRDQTLDVSDPTGGRNAIGNRVQNAIQHWAAGGYMDPSEIYPDHNGQIGFQDGRHRLVAAYQLGHRWAPVLVADHKLESLQEIPIRFKNTESITEAKAAPLYHFTDMDAAGGIAQTDTLRKGNRNDRDFVSLSRNPNHFFAETAEAVFVLDQEKLSRKYKIVPDSGDYVRIFSYLKYDTNKEFEERILSDIKPLHRFLKEIRIEADVFYDDLDEYARDRAMDLNRVQQYAKKYGIPLNTFEVRGDRRYRWYRESINESDMPEFQKLSDHEVDMDQYEYDDGTAFYNVKMDGRRVAEASLRFHQKFGKKPNELWFNFVLASGDRDGALLSPGVKGDSKPVKEILKAKIGDEELFYDDWKQGEGEMLNQVFRRWVKKQLEDHYDNIIKA